MIAPRTINRARKRRDVFALGASAGGVEALETLFAALDPELRAIVLCVIHRSRFRHSMLAEVLARNSRLPVSEPSEGERLERGRIYLAPRDHHLLVVDGRAVLNRGPLQHFTRPAIDPMFASAASCYGERVAGIVLTGAGHDGVAGAIAINAAGGMMLTQHPDEAFQRSMPQKVMLHDHVAGLFRIADLSKILLSLSHGEAAQALSPALSPALSGRGVM